MQRFVAALVAAVILLIPVQCLLLPFNMSPVDVFSIVCLPLVWFWLLRIRRPVRLPYMASMWAILAVTGFAVLASRDPGGSFPLVVKEIYLYLWLVTLAAVFEHAGGRVLRWLLHVWCLAAFLHGALILAQFVDPALLAVMNRDLTGVGSLDPYRPSGLMENSNAAGVFQVTAFVPLLVLRPPRAWLIVLGSLLLLMTLGTGSMAAALACATGLVAGLVGLLVWFADWRAVSRFAIATCLAGALGAVVVSLLLESMPEMQQRVHYVLTGRSEYSAAGRFEIWKRGTTLLMAEPRLFGIGPDMYKRVDGHEAHNDLLSFALERGPLGLLALLAFAAAAGSRSLQVVRAWYRRGERFAMVFPAAMVALAITAQTHEIFHQRPLWLVLALQEAMLWRARHAALPAPLLPADAPELAPATLPGT